MGGAADGPVRENRRRNLPFGRQGAPRGYDGGEAAQAAPRGGREDLGVGLYEDEDMVIISKIRSIVINTRFKRVGQVSFSPRCGCLHSYTAF